MGMTLWKAEQQQQKIQSKQKKNTDKSRNQ
jgi:hypothetical protein